MTPHSGKETGREAPRRGDVSITSSEAKRNLGVESHIANKKIILAISGGIDSMVLADLLLKAKADFVLAHCNFHLRGEESDDDEQFVRDYAERNGLTLYVKQFDTTCYAKEQGLSIEMAARELRYAWFEELRQQLGYEYIAVAHHADDQLETFFINLLRGAGIRGLKGMQPVNGNIIRPLLDFSREEIHQYAIENGIKWREDHTNVETQFLRNKIRHELLPVIDKISKESRASILKSISHLASENELYRELLKEKLDQMVTQDGETQRIPHSSLLLFEWLRNYGFNSDQVHFVYEALNGQPGTAFFSPTHRVTVERDGLELTPLCQQQDALDELSYEQFANDDRYILDKSPEVAQMDYDKLTFPLKLRKWQAGDRFHPIGMKGSRLLSDFLKDLKLTTSQKENISVLLTADEEIVWIVGLRVDERFKVTNATRTILKVSIKD
ncbi:MAG: tRNA lysidine(34) synthetase TilS [Bacteroidales bacterium]|nr:tRNA lysidine(34) synthetase TilS [Bacteroidales bacterium]